MNALAAVAGWTLQGVLRRAVRVAAVALAVETARSFGAAIGKRLADRVAPPKRRRAQRRRAAP